MVPELVRSWATGWAVSRGRPRPTELPWGQYIDVGTPEQEGRHVLPLVDESLVRQVAGSVTRPHTWLKAPVGPEEIRPWLPRGWVVHEEDTGHLMAVDLRFTDPVRPAGYTMSVETREGVTYVRLYDTAGEVAAKGQMAMAGQAAVVDKVTTEPAHRRRGLGAFVMRTLADRAVTEGAVRGVLGATDEGRALYESLGWKAHAPLAACAYLPEG